MPWAGWSVWLRHPSIPLMVRRSWVTAKPTRHSLERFITLFDAGLSQTSWTMTPGGIVVIDLSTVGGRRECRTCQGERGM